MPEIIFKSNEPDQIDMIQKILQIKLEKLKFLKIDDQQFDPICIDKAMLMNEENNLSICEKHADILVVRRAISPCDHHHFHHNEFNYLCKTCLTWTKGQILEDDHDCIYDPDYYPDCPYGLYYSGASDVTDSDEYQLKELENLIFFELNGENQSSATMILCYRNK